MNILKLTTPFLFSIFGVILTLGVCLCLNDQSSKKDTTNVKKQTSFSVETVPPKVVKQKPKPPRKAKNTMKPPPLPLFDASIPGLSLEFDALEMNIKTGLLDEDDSKDLVLSADDVDIAPRVLRRQQVNYPTIAVKKGIEGHVTLSVLITAEGRAKDIVVVDTQPPGVFDYSAIDCLKNWEFKPAQFQNNAVNVRITQTIRFNLR